MTSFARHLPFPVTIVIAIWVVAGTIYEFKKLDWLTRICYASMGFCGLFIGLAQMVEQLALPLATWRTAFHICAGVSFALFLTMLICSTIKKYKKGAKEPRRLR